jgi:hypothetical protein
MGARHDYLRHRPKSCRQALARALQGHVNGLIAARAAKIKNDFQFHHGGKVLFWDKKEQP